MPAEAGEDSSAVLVMAAGFVWQATGVAGWSRAQVPAGAKKMARDCSSGAVRGRSCGRVRKAARGRARMRAVCRGTAAHGGSGFTRAAQRLPCAPGKGVPATMKSQ
ncbi:hypothetical protein GCM10022229_01050 [Luteimonas lutimaris]|uniref:Uncharacterized protein n=1 Tax=Luteimonas lutimaris TaxID=698645 RepID=A0ABP7M563_9GAMM